MQINPIPPHPTPADSSHLASQQLDPISSLGSGAYEI